jgi:hypothetical protein
MRAPDTSALAVLGLLLATGLAGAEPPGRATDASEAPAVARAAAPGAERAPDAPEGGGFSYYYVSGATLEARDSATGWDYSGTGCKYTIGGTDRIVNTELQIPDGSTIKYLRIYYNDTSAGSDVQGFITRYDAGTGTEDVVSVSSTGAGGVGTALSAEITHVVDNFGYAYVLIGWPGASSSQVQICGLRVAYYAPVLFIDGFETGDTSRWSLTTP